MKCPLCGKASTQILTKELRKGEKKKVFFCNTCELGILDSKKSAEELKKFYSKEYRKNEKLTSAGDPEMLFNVYSKFQSDRLRLLAPYLTKKTKLLEVGCSAGMFLYHAKKRVKEVVGIDFDLASAKYAAKKCGCRVYTTEIQATPLKKKYFDVICSFQTLEHVDDPEQFIRELSEYLAPGGVLAIEVPNLYDVLVYVYNLPHHQKFFYHAAHLWYFTQKSMEKLMAKVGITGTTHHIQDYNIMNHIHWVLRDEPQTTGVPGLSLPSLPIRDTIAKTTNKKMQDFISRVDSEYKKLLADQHISSNILFIGKKKKAPTRARSK